MPQPTKEEFDAAAQKVMQTAPAGLSQEQFFDLVDKELNPFQGSYGMMAKSAATNGQPEGGPHEPDTYWGGFLGSIKKDLSGVPDALSHAAMPSSVGDFLSLILPSELEEARPAAANLGKAAIKSAKDAGGRTTHQIGAALRGARDYAFPEADDQTIASQGFNRLPLVKQMDHLPATSVERPSPAMVPTSPAAGNPVNDLPLYLQQSIMEDAGKEPSVPLTGGRAASARPSDLGHETINQTLEEALSGNKPKTVGQDTLFGAPAEFHSVVPVEESILNGKPIPPEKVSQLTPDEWLSLRNHYGARDAATLTGKTADEVRTLSGGGPSRTPQVAIDRIREAQLKARTQQ